MAIQIVALNGMLNIESDDIIYSNIKQMYKDNINGHALQLSEELEPNRKEILNICADIASNIYKLEEIVKK